MASKISHTLCVVLWLSLLLLLFHELFHFKSGIINTKEIVSTTYPSIPRRSSFNRKVLASKIDFSPFQKKQQQNHHHPHYQDHHHEKQQVHRNGDGKEIDPRYGVEKRLVPTGPNPLHH
ncbi:CLE12, putative [Ricinus communis]|uniref:CLE12, putative n=1 Tax=Ricinus communis TaxID=3988 RepID=B9SEH9_RICCO|nr:CLE12, putative [Ricinus communis]|eukprot:XP_002524398.1 CLAVATA3/ESR (CLE)-related protein 12 [Ricinus communis]